jgi:hypothetical protein
MFMKVFVFVEKLYEKFEASEGKLFQNKNTRNGNIVNGHFREPVILRKCKMEKLSDNVLKLILL